MSTTEASNTNTSQGSFVGNHIDIHARVIFIIISSLEILSGVFGNWLLLTVLFTRRSQQLRNYHHIFIANLALADLLSLGYWMPYFVVDLIRDEHPVVNTFHCIFNGFVVCTCQSAGVLSLVCISLNRYLHVCHSHIYPRVFCLKHIIICTVLSWLIAAVLALPPVFQIEGSYDFSYKYNKVLHFCSYDRHNRNVYAKTVVMTFCVLPMCLVGYWNIAIFRHWKKASLNVHARYPLLKRGQKKRISLRSKPKPLKKKKKDAEENVDIEQDSEENLSRDVTEQETAVSRLKAQSSEQEIVTSVPKIKITRPTTLHLKGIVAQPSQTPNKGSSKNLAIQASLNSAAKVAKENSPLPPRKTNQCALSLPNLSVEHSKKELDKNALGKSQELIGSNPNPNSPKQAKKLREGLKILHKAKAEGRSSSRSEQDWMAGASNCSPERQGFRGNFVSLGGSLKTGGPSLKLRPFQSLHNVSNASMMSKNALQRLRRRAQKERAREGAFLRSLFVVFLLMAISFLPYAAALVVDTVKLGVLSAEVGISSALLLFLNCSVNWIVYGAMNRSFRRGYVSFVQRVLTACSCPCSWLAGEGLNMSMTSIMTASAVQLDAGDQQADTPEISASEA